MTLEQLFAALADRTRLRILSLIEDKEICVCYFVEALEAPQPTVSRHLAYLREAGLVEARREGKWMHYRIAKLPKAQARIVEKTLAAMKDEADVSGDRKRMKAACCDPELVGIAGAPEPRAVVAHRAARDSS
jgi:ArsR family transcriptional regulator